MYDFLAIVLLVVVFWPIVWQIPRVFWPVRLNASGTAFTGLYRRYSVGSFTGYASDVSESSETRTVGSISGHTSGAVSGGSFTGTTSISDNRRQFTTYHTRFFLTDQAGTTCNVDAANVGASIGQGHLVSAAWLVHNRKPGNAFLVYDHTTNGVYVETTKRGMGTARRGLGKMVFRLPLAHQVILILGIVTIPLVALFGISAHGHLRLFRNHGVRPLVSKLDRRAAEFPSMRLQGANKSNATDVRDLATQVKEIAALHESGALSHEEFQAAKAKVLDTTEAHSPPAYEGWPTG